LLGKQSRVAGRDKKAHRFSGGYSGQRGRVPRGRQINPFTPRRNVPYPGHSGRITLTTVETVGYHLPSRPAGLSLCPLGETVPPRTLLSTVN